MHFTAFYLHYTYMYEANMFSLYNNKEVLYKIDNIPIRLFVTIHKNVAGTSSSKRRVGHFETWKNAYCFQMQTLYFLTPKYLQVYKTHTEHWCLWLLNLLATRIIITKLFC